MFHRRASGALAVAFCVGCLAPTGAVAALEPGVHVDPGSPAAKEYGVPLWVLRGDASGQQSPEGIPPPPLFGVGIGPAGTGGGKASGKTSAGRPSGAGGSGGAGAAGGGASRGSRSASGSAPALSAAAIAELIRQGSPTPDVALASGGVVLGGLLVGGVFALGWRRRTR